MRFNHDRNVHFNKAVRKYEKNEIRIPVKVDVIYSLLFFVLFIFYFYFTLYSM